MTTILNFEQLFDDRVRDAASRFTAAQKDRAIGQAVARYSKHRPRVAVQDYPGDSATYDLALPAGWVTEFSNVQSIEYPAGQRQPLYLDDADFMLYRTPTGMVIRLYTTTPATGNTARVTYTKPHAVDQSGSSIPAPDEGAVADLAAAIGLRDLAALYSGTTDPSIQADATDYKSKAKEYSDRATALETRWQAHMGLDKDAEVGPAGGFVDQDQTGSWGGDHLTHPNRTR